MGVHGIVEWIDEHKPKFEKMALDIWANPETAYREKQASRRQIEALAEAGFRIRAGVGGIPTAFVAEFGSGSPVIGILGEFDALPGLSQRVAATRAPLGEDDAAPGHGCGHNLLGTAGVAAAIAVAVRLRLAAKDGNGTIRYYGCPAEEVLSGKTFMARDGVFDDLDAALTWHPGSANLSFTTSTSALTSVEFRFAGKAAHAGVSPHLGRSTLDAVELTNVAANYLREHVPEGARIHYTITSGGVAPNIVPDRASVWYYLRGANRAQADELLRRLVQIAQGAALMTETGVEWEIKAAAWDVLPNDTLNRLLLEQRHAAGELSFSEEEERWAMELTDSLDPSALEESRRFYESLGVPAGTRLPTGAYVFRPSGTPVGGGSTDLGDVSWIAPVGSVTTTCAPVGVQLHTWQATASFGSAIGLKGMHYASKLLASAAYELIAGDGEALAGAREEFDRRRGGRTYSPGIPAEAAPPVPT